MAVVATHLTQGSDNGALSTSTTASITPGANQLVFIVVKTRGISNTPTVTGCNLTWAQVVTGSGSDGTNTHRLTMLRATGSPTTGALTIDFGGQNPISEWSVDEFSGVDVSGTSGANGVVQSVVSSAASGTSFAVTLAAFSNIKNPTYGFSALQTFTTLTKGASFTELSNSSSGSGTNEAQWANSNQTNVNWTSGASNFWIGGAVELKEFTPGGNFIFNLL